MPLLCSFEIVGHDERVSGVIVGADALFYTRREEIVSLAARYALPAIYTNKESATFGGLMSYGVDILDVFRQVGLYTGQILKGAKPAELPVVQSTKLEFLINAQAARLLGIEVPNALQLLADEVIE